MRHLHDSRKMIRTLLAATALAGFLPASAMADDAGNEALVKRVAELEALVARLMDKLDTQEVAITEQRQRIDKTETAVANAPAAAVPAAQTAEAKPKDGFMVGNTLVKLGGYIKADAIALKNSGGNLPGSADITRDFYIPGSIPVGGASSDWATDFSARQTRFYFTTNTDVGGETIGTRLEMDFNVTAGGDERVSNSYTPRMRQAYLTYGNWLAGQSWTTFQNVASLPDSVDFIGTTEGTVFARQTMLRYTSGPFQIAVEEPEATITTAVGSRVLSGSDPMPDLVVRYNHTADWGQISLAGILRDINAEAGLAGLTEGASAMGYGLSLAGKVNVAEKDDFRFMATVGSGLGRYIGLNIVNDAAVDPIAQDLETIDTFSAFGAYRHVWAEKSRSSLMFSYFKADNPVALTSAAVTDQAWSLRGNFIYSPVPNLDFGLEYGYSERTLENGLDGAQHRLQFMSKFSF